MHTHLIGVLFATIIMFLDTLLYEFGSEMSLMFLSNSMVMYTALVLISVSTVSNFEPSNLGLCVGLAARILSRMDMFASSFYTLWLYRLTCPFLLCLVFSYHYMRMIVFMISF
jgi:hypothetical protein